MATLIGVKSRFPIYRLRGDDRLNNDTSVTKVHINQLWHDEGLHTTYIVKAFEDGMAHITPYSGKDVKSYWVSEHHVVQYYKFAGFYSDIRGEYK